MSERWPYKPATMAIPSTLRIMLNHKGLSLYLASSKPQADYSSSGVDGFYSCSFAHSRIYSLGSEA